MRAPRVQRVDQSPIGRSCMRGDAIQPVVRRREGQRRGQRTEGGAGIAKEEIGLEHREAPRQPEL